MKTDTFTFDQPDDRKRMTDLLGVRLLVLRKRAAWLRVKLALWIVVELLAIALVCVAVDELFGIGVAIPAGFLVGYWVRGLA